MSKKNPVKREVVTPDKHFPLHDQAAINVVCKSIEIVKPDTYIDIGDVGEWESTSHWKWAKKKRPPLEYIMPDIEKDIIDFWATRELNFNLDDTGLANLRVTNGVWDFTKITFRAR